MSGTTCKRNRPTMAETPTQVIADSDHHNSKCYMWVHRSGEFYTRRPIVIYEYQKGRDHQKPLDFYKDYKGILVTDSLQQYHLVDKKLADVKTQTVGRMQGVILRMRLRLQIKKIHRL